MPIRVETYTAGGVATGVVARSGPLREALETPATCSSNAPTGCRWTGPASSPRVSSA